MAFGKTKDDTHTSIHIKGRRLRVLSVLSIWVSTSLKISLGPSMLQFWSRRLTSVSSSWGDWRRSICFLRFSGTSTTQREHPYQLHLSMVWQLLCLGPQSIAESGKNCPTHHWVSTPNTEAVQWKRCLQRVCSIVRDTSHHSHTLFTLTYQWNIYVKYINIFKEDHISSGWEPETDGDQRVCQYAFRSLWSDRTTNS